MPLQHIHLTSLFGYRRHPITGITHFHSGVDLSAEGDTVYSVLKGTVIKIAESTSLGRGIYIDHGMVISIYGHLSAIAVKKGQRVNAGQAIAITGATGRVTGEHLHFAIQYRTRFIPPLRFLQELSSTLSPTIPNDHE